LAQTNYRVLRPDRIIETQRRLQARIAARFPRSGLSEVAAELLSVTEEAAARAESIRRPNLPLRAAVAALLLAAAAGLAAMGRSLRLRADLWEVTTLAQFAEAGLGALVFVGVAVLFLLSLELRWKRRRALAALHELRAIAHVVDMHQVAKDPEGLLRRGPVATAASGLSTTTLFELNRYLNYCNELLALVSKVAALYVQGFPDPHAVSAVDEIEALCSGLSQRIWQKIMVLELVLDDAPPGQTADRPEAVRRPPAVSPERASDGQGGAREASGQ
jgi:hypothetical protein